MAVPAILKNLPFLRVLEIFMATSLRRRVTVLACLFASNLVEGIGLVSLMPLLSIAMGGTQESSLTHWATTVLGTVGLTPTVGVLVLIILAVVVLRSAVSLIALSQVGYAVAEVTTRLRLSLLSSLFDVRWAYFGRQPVGHFGTAIGIESTRAGEAFLSVAQLITLISQCILYIGLAVLVSWKVCLASLLLGGTIVLSLNKLVRSARRAGKQQSRRTKSLVARLTDALIGVKPLKAMGRHAHFAKLFTSDVGELNESLRRQVFYRQAAKSLQDPMLAIFLAIGLYLAHSLGHIPIAELLVMGLLMGRVVTGIGKAQQMYLSVAINEAAYKGVVNAIAEARREREPATGTKLPALARGIFFYGVSFSFGAKSVLREVSLTIPAGKVTTLTGASGAGKTTVSDLLLGFYQPSRGEIRIDDVPLQEVDLYAWRRMVGYVPQEVILFHDTVLANVTLGEPQFTREDAQRALERAGAWDFVASLPDGLDSVVGERGTLVSGGQRQRIAIARALVHDPKLLILDEATSALDPETEAAICRNLREVSEASSLTILAISHQQAWVDAAERVYHLGRQEVTLVRDTAPRVLAS